MLSSTQRLIQVDNALYLLETVSGLRELGIQQRLPGSQHFQIGRVTMLHQQ